jgi:5-formyltetrahydrofolate cyclo-ligase
LTPKQQQRRDAYDSRNAQIDKDSLSDIICTQFVSQQEYIQANTVMWYLHCRSEVRTIKAVNSAIDSSKRVVIPYCTKDDTGNNKLGLWLVEDLAELTAGTWGILEPPKSRWGEKNKEILPEELDLIMVPGIAFDKNGGRLGNGAGYYDRLLSDVTSKTHLIAICYESQMCNKVVMEEHDIFMHAILTEKSIYKS